MRLAEAMGSDSFSSMSDSALALKSAIRWAVVPLLVVAAAATVLLLMGRVPFCKCGYVKLWHGTVFSAENSQHISDWYSFSHIIHGFLFYAALWLIGRNWRIDHRLALATAIEAAWEVFENTDFIINRYRAVTVSLDYYGDSVINSVSDILFMILGFYLASRLPVSLIITLAIAMEVIVGAIIRDNLTLNIIMLLWPSEAIRTWQSGA